MGFPLIIKETGYNVVYNKLTAGVNKVNSVIIN